VFPNRWLGSYFNSLLWAVEYQIPVESIPVVFQTYAFQPGAYYIHKDADISMHIDVVALWITAAPYQLACLLDTVPVWLDIIRIIYRIKWPR
jgi:hypothetical protein